jgi:hypothetical protein
MLDMASHVQALHRFKMIKAKNVAPESKNPSESPYKGQEGELRSILSKHGVLTADGWKFVTNELVKDLMKWKTTT